VIAVNRKCGAGWPLDKSLCGIPHLYHLSLAYGRNLLTGEPSPAGQWRVRNVVAWCRPNPPVGALGDKFRPATSYMTIACRARDRWFDLDAVRHQNDRSDEQTTANDKGGVRGAMQSPQNPAGAPPLDWWNVSTEPYSGSHYATWPRKLLDRPIKAMCPMQVCVECGQPRRRIVGDVNYNLADIQGGPAGDTSDNTGRNGAPGRFGTYSADTVGWSDCGHDTLAQRHRPRPVRRQRHHPRCRYRPRPRRHRHRPRRTQRRAGARTHRHVPHRHRHDRGRGVSDPQLFEPPEPVAVPASRRPLLAPGDAAKRLRVIATGMRAAADSGLARPVLAADIADIEEAADLLDPTSYPKD
jgi:hypothetical protein